LTEQYPKQDTIVREINCRVAENYPAVILSLTWPWISWLSIKDSSVQFAQTGQCNPGQYAIRKQLREEVSMIAGI